MRVMLMTQVFPYPPDSGPKVKTYNVLKYLALQHQVTLVSFIRAGEEKHTVNLEQYCEAIHTVEMKRSRRDDLRFLVGSLISGKPFLIARDWSDVMGLLVARLLSEKKFDVIHADQLGMAQYAMLAKDTYRVLDEHNAVYTIVKRLAEAEGWRLRRPFLELEWRKLKRYEAALCREFDHVLTVIDEDRRALMQASGFEDHFTTVPIAIDVAETPRVKRNEGVTDVVSIATMFYPPNVDGVLWFAKEVFPLITRQNDDTRFVIVGARPPQEVRRLAEKNPRIVVTGYVEDLNPVLARAAVLVVPLRSGSGMRVKILEAFARGIPVISTTIGFEGIGVTPGKDILVADSPSAFADGVLRLINDRPAANKIVDNARRLVEEQYDWRRACGGLERAYAGAKQPLSPFAPAH